MSLVRVAFRYPDGDYDIWYFPTIPTVGQLVMSRGQHWAVEHVEAEDGQAIVRLGEPARGSQPGPATS